jgi:methionyl-tRNA formyltransferase
MKIVFMGTPDFATGVLQAILQSSHQVVGVITAPDKPSGRGRKLNSSSVKTFALSQGLTVLQPKNLKDPEFLEALKALNADIQVVVAFRMLPKQVWQMPKLGTFNLHASLLPDYRGAAPINWAIINGESQSGVTTFFIDDKIDTGAVIDQTIMDIADEETLGELHDRMMVSGAELVNKTLNDIENQSYTLKEQDIDNPKMAPKLNPENCKIIWNQPGEKIFNLIRGLNPYPAAWTTIQNGSQEIKAKIYKVSFHRITHQKDIGTLEQTKKELFVYCSDGKIEIKTIKIAGKKVMDTQSLLNGFNFESNSFCS